LATQSQPATPERDADVISGAVADLMREYTGTEPSAVETTINDGLVTVVMRDTLLKAQHRLAREGKGLEVIDMRRRFQETMREELTAIVTTHTGRTVEAFLSASGAEPDIEVEIFILAPRSAR
jgi:uncharacterized protein YbcI